MEALENVVAIMPEDSDSEESTSELKQNFITEASRTLAHCSQFSATDNIPSFNEVNELDNTEEISKNPLDDSHLFYTLASAAEIPDSALFMPTEDKSFPCGACAKVFKSKEALKQHSLKHSAEKPFKCQLCDASYRWRSSLRAHVQSHSPDMPYKCTVCDSRFRRKENMKKHMTTHSARKPFKCKSCNNQYKDKWNLKLHLLDHLKKNKLKHLNTET